MKSIEPSEEGSILLSLGTAAYFPWFVYYSAFAINLMAA